MADVYPPMRQRSALLAFAGALGSVPTALRRDENSDWRITGERGHIYAVAGVLIAGLRNREGFLIYGRCDCYLAASRAWTFAKRDMTFAVITADGDDEGFLFLDRLPTPPEAQVIRARLGIRKKREVGDAERERLRTVSGLQAVKNRLSPFRSLPTISTIERSRN